MSEIFGIEFDKHIHKSLFDEIDFKDSKALLANKNVTNKLQYFIQEFPVLLERQDFLNILITTTNPTGVWEIFDSQPIQNINFIHLFNGRKISRRYP